MTCVLRLNYKTMTVGCGPHVPIPRNPLVRFVIRDLRQTGRPLHWRDCALAWNYHLAATRQLDPYTDADFWQWLRPALERDLVTAEWNAEWAAS